MTLDLELSRDPDSSKVLLCGWPEDAPPQLMVRERVGGRFLGARGWQTRSTYVPLVPFSAVPGSFSLEADGSTLPEGTPVQLEVPAAGLSVQAIWPKASGPPAEPASVPEPDATVPTAEDPPQPQPARGRFPAFAVLALIAAVAFTTGGFLAWFVTTTIDGEVIRQLEGARDARTATLDAREAELARQATALEQGRSQLSVARRQLDADRTALQIDRSQLEADKVQFTAEQNRLKQERQTQAPAGVPPAAPSWLPAPAAGPASAAPAPPQAPQPLSAGVPPPSPAGQEAALQCDVLAANPYDRNRNASIAGVTMPQLRANSGAAIAACKAASEAFPGDMRFTYQYARALQSVSPDQAVPILQNLMRQRYAAAYDNMAWIVASRGNTAQAAQYLREGVALGDIEALFSLAVMIKDGKVQARPGENYRDMLIQASRMGHTGAYTALNDPPPFDPVRALFGR